jgi:hypothetical protein
MNHELMSKSPITTVTASAILSHLQDRIDAETGEILAAAPERLVGLGPAATRATCRAIADEIRRSAAALTAEAIRQLEAAK